MNLLDQIRTTIRAKLDQRAAAQAELDTLLETVGTEGRSELTEAETATFAEIRGRLAGFDAELEPLQAREAELVDAEARSAAARAAADALPESKRPAPVQVQVRSDEHTYRMGGEHSFLADLFALSPFGASAGMDDRSARDRLNRHRSEVAIDREQRDMVVSDFGGLIPPQYLLDLYAPLARAGRPFLNALISRPLPETGVSFTIPRVTTGSAAAAASDGGSWNEQNMAETDLTFKAELVTAQEDISRTTFMRGGWVVDQIVFPDMIAAYHAKLDAYGINGSGTSPQHRGILQVSGINAVTYTDASPTVAEIWPKLADALQQVNSNRYAPATFWLMHPRRWGWFTAAVDSNGRPVLPNALNVPQNAMGVGNAAEYGQIVGNLMGLPVITDANVVTDLTAGTGTGGTEDIIVAVRGFDVLLQEANGGEPYSFTFEQVGAPGQVRLAVGGFSGFTAGRYPKAVATVSGTGLAAPSF